MWGSSICTAQVVLMISWMQAESKDSDQRIISVEHGHDVTLSCEAPGRGNIIVVEWIRSDLEDGYVLLYRDKQLDPRYQLQSYRDRVGLPDLQVKNRTISLVLKNVTSDDEGTYESRVFKRDSPRHQRSVIGGDPVCSISLRVGPPGTPQKKNRSDGLRASLYLCVISFLFLMFEVNPVLTGTMRTVPVVRRRKKLRL